MDVKIDGATGTVLRAEGCVLYGRGMDWRRNADEHFDAAMSTRTLRGPLRTLHREIVHTRCSGGARL